jgi:glycosyltransferase involved in cell wall biosynthesis
MPRENTRTADATPEVSVVTPSLNQGRVIEQAILSIGKGARVEHVVQDGGSTDDTLAILRRHPHVVWRSEPDGGQSDALNRGFRLARGSILGWLNADDLYLPDTVEVAAAFLAAHPEVDLIYGDCLFADEDGVVRTAARSGPLDVQRLLTFDQALPQSTIFFRRHVLDRVGPLDSTLHLAMDVDFGFRAALRCRIAYVPALRAAVRVHPASKSSTRLPEVLPEIFGILDRTFADPALPPPLAGLRREAFGAAVVAAGIRAYNAGDRREARRLLWDGLRQAPNPLRRRTLKAILFLLDSTLGSRLGSRLRSRSQRRALRAIERRRYPRSGPAPSAPRPVRSPASPSRRRS